MHEKFFCRLACTRNNSGNQGQRPSSCHLLRVAEIDRRVPCKCTNQVGIRRYMGAENSRTGGGAGWRTSAAPPPVPEYQKIYVEARGAFVRNTAEGACPFRPCRGSPGSGHELCPLVVHVQPCSVQLYLVRTCIQRLELVSSGCL